MIKGQAVKTKADPNSKGGAYYVYDKPAGTKIGALPTSYVMGFFLDEKSVNGVSYIYVKLTQPLKGYSSVYIESSKVYEWIPQTEYVIKSGSTNVNIRSGSSRSSSVIKTMNSGQSVGKSDGFKMGDFLLFKLTSGGYGWVHKDYVSIKTNGSSKQSGGSTSTGQETPITGRFSTSTLIRYCLILFAFILLVSIVRGLAKDSNKNSLESSAKPSKKMSQNPNRSASI